jgi:cytochrome c-type biogenesis protein CcmH/NrfG
MSGLTTVDGSPKTKACDARCVHPQCMELRRKAREAEVERLIDVFRNVLHDGPSHREAWDAVESLAKLAKERF